jgi:YHS domain-containing protein
MINANKKGTGLDKYSRRGIIYPYPRYRYIIIKFYYMYNIDPVCHKKLKKKQEYAIINNQGKVYHLCCLACKTLFVKHPDYYIRNISNNKN